MTRFYESIQLAILSKNIQILKTFFYSKDILSQVIQGYRKTRRGFRIKRILKKIFLKAQIGIFISDVNRPAKSARPGLGRFGPSRFSQI